MKKVTQQYDAYPYPERDPEDERKRLITGSPSDPMEIDHFLFGGKRDWRNKFRALVAGGGTGDGLIQLAQKLKDAGCPAEIIYIDLSTSARKIAEKRAEIRGLTGITFVTGGLEDAPQYGPFDYIDCCGVLHHLADPQSGFSALAQALAPGGGIGVMVYAPYGRSGVYPLQAAFAGLGAEMTPEQKLALGKATMNTLPVSHPFLANQIVGDHKVSDAGFYDLLLHSQDRPYTVAELNNVVNAAGLSLVSFTQPLMYDPTKLMPHLKPIVQGIDPIVAMNICEALRGDIKTHVAYLNKPGESKTLTLASDPMAVPHITGNRKAALAHQIAKAGRLELKRDVISDWVELPKASAKLIQLVDGKRNLQEIAGAGGLDWFAFIGQWGAISRELSGFGLLLYSQQLR